MRILLISANTETINMPVLPLGMASVAAAAEKAGHDVWSLNLLGSSDPVVSLEEAFSRITPDVIGISVRNIDDQFMQKPRFLLDPVAYLVDACKKRSVAPVILGGAGYSIFPQSSLDYTNADYGIQGEGEEALPLVLEFLAARRNPASLPGVHVFGAKRNNPPCFSRDLGGQQLPLPGVHLAIPESLENEELWLPYQTRRGCPMKCSYCSTPIIEGKTIRGYDIQFIIENISRFVESGIDRFFFVDNVFNIPAFYAEKLCDAIIKAGINIKWRCIVYPSGIDEKLAGKMARAGCQDVSLGFESGSAPVLKCLNKKYKPGDAKKTAEILNSFGIRQMGFLLLGGPGETRETVFETLDFADTLPLDALKITVGIRIYPNTPMADRAIEEGFISASDDLLKPRFYVRPELSGWLFPFMENWAEERSHCMF